MNVVCDSNIILDLILQRQPFFDEAEKCFFQLHKNKDKVFISASMVTDIYYIIQKELKDSVAAKHEIAKILNGYINIISVDGDDCAAALNLPLADYEDALVAVCAKKTKCKWIITRNAAHFAHSPVKAVTPHDFLRNSSLGDYRNNVK